MTCWRFRKKASKKVIKGVLHFDQWDEERWSWLDDPGWFVCHFPARVHHGTLASSKAPWVRRLGRARARPPSSTINGLGGPRSQTFSERIGRVSGLERWNHYVNSMPLLFKGQLLLLLVTIVNDGKWWHGCCKSLCFRFDIPRQMVLCWAGTKKLLNPRRENSLSATQIIIIIFICCCQKMHTIQGYKWAQPSTGSNSYLLRINGCKEVTNFMCSSLQHTQQR